MMATSVLMNGGKSDRLHFDAFVLSTVVKGSGLCISTSKQFDLVVMVHNDFSEQHLPTHTTPPSQIIMVE